MKTAPVSTIRAIITGTTGMVGEGILHDCLQDPQVEAVLVINRKSCGVTHPKLTEILHSDFFDLSPIKSQLQGYNACFFALGVSSVGMTETEYYRMTYTLTLHVAEVLSQLNPDMTFCYVSGRGTDSTEKGKIMWARVKGKTENDLLKLPFKQNFMYRPSYMQPTKGLKNTQIYYNYLTWIYPLGRTLFPNYFCSLTELGLSMLQVTKEGYPQRFMEVKDIVASAKSDF